MKPKFMRLFEVQSGDLIQYTPKLYGPHTTPFYMVLAKTRPHDAIARGLMDYWALRLFSVKENRVVETTLNEIDFEVHWSCYVPE